MENNNAPRQPVSLAGGGESWKGWIFGPYGKARDFRLIAPDGATYTALEIGALRSLTLDLDHLRGRVLELAELVDARAFYFTPSELNLIESAAAILGRIRARPSRRRMPAALSLVR